MSQYNPVTQLAFAERPVVVQYYNPSTTVTVSNGNVVVINGVPYIAQGDIPPLTMGTVAFNGCVWSGLKAAGAWTAGDMIFWNAAATQNYGGTGAYTNIAAGGGVFVGYALITPGTTAGALTGDNYGYFVKSVSPAGSANNIIPDPGATGAIPVTNSGTVNITTAGAETRTIAAPAAAGLSLILVAYSVGAGTATVNSATTNIGAASHQHIALTANGQSIELLSIAVTGGTFRWAVRYNDGTTIS
jgi:Uncharacterized conserved protein (DUF2190)